MVFNASLRQNLSMARPKATTEEMTEAGRGAGSPGGGDRVFIEFLMRLQGVRVCMCVCQGSQMECLH